MAFYYVNKKAQDNGDHEVHTSTYTYLPIEDNRLYFGIYDNCTSAVKEAKNIIRNQTVATIAQMLVIHRNVALIAGLDLG
ncbi:hypothetical protein Sbal195_2232 [Shewanella baltica OS195]|uniref:Uncharacterized protein n=1 Tax=Shewanella baltica (strain OS195) TaxID=399599 RepID=A9L1Y3_SHEB9|nr:hypothetical protein [Shewanella baltica]ABX49401.1 hypothetical protein Sbal195_2232 [Shewanella baltica OS195]ADT94394.1 hypothetical protein Sbal678_2237 [Shewanella baltica OS678]